MALTEGLLLALLLYTGRSVWGWAFTSEQEVVDYVSQCIPFIAIVAVLDALQAVVSGVARGCGWQAYAAAANLGSYYIVGLPVALVLAFVYDFKVVGLCMGLFAGIFTQAVALVILTLMTDWRKQAENALDRVYSSASATLPIESNQSQKDEIPSLHKFNGHEIIS
jgi:MATE family multidrug resistance protein